MRTGRPSRSVPSHGWKGSSRESRADSGETTTDSPDASSGEGFKKPQKKTKTKGVGHEEEEKGERVRG